MKKAVIGIFAHVDAGKTTLAESLLYCSGKLRSQGRVDNKNTLLDSEALEKARGITIFAGEAHFSYGDSEFTVIDTPGHIDFASETERIIDVIDYAIVVISASEMIQSHTRTVIKLLKNKNVPIFIFVTKCDMQRKDRSEILLSLKREITNIADFSQIGGDFADIESIASFDESLLDEYFESGSLSDHSISKAVSEEKIYPVFFGSGLKNEGITEFLSALDRFTAEKSYPEKFSAIVYKIAHDNGERISRLKITGGKLRVKNSLSDYSINEKINQIRIYNGAKFSTVNEVSAGEVCAVTGLNSSYAGLGIGTENSVSSGMIEPVVRYRVIPPENYDPRKFLSLLRYFEEEDPKLGVSYEEAIGEFHCKLMGKVQAEIFKSLFKEKFGIDIEIADGKVIYKETIAAPVEGIGHFEPLRHYSEVHLLIEPNKRGGGLEFKSILSEDELDRNWQNLIMTHLAEKTHIGVCIGAPLTDLKISLVGGRAHIKHTEGGDFRQATYRAVRQGLMQAKSIILEPFYDYRLELPSDLIGRAMNDIRAMGGDFTAPEIFEETAILCGKAPVVNMDSYMLSLASYSGGRAKLSLSFAGYDLCHNADEVISASDYDPERDTENTADSVFCDHGAGHTVKWNEVENYMHLPKYLK